MVLPLITIEMSWDPGFGSYAGADVGRLVAAPRVTLRLSHDRPVGCSACPGARRGRSIFRKGMDGLAALVREEAGAVDP